jgi:FHS family L-fucose permease-like MFS transporter
VGSILILGSIAKVDPKTLSGAALNQFVSEATQIIAHTYIGLAVALSLLAGVVWLRRKRLVEAPADPTPLLQGFNLLKRPRFAFGTLCIFLYVGGEVAIGSAIVNYLMQPQILGLGAEAAGKHIQFYWGGAMLGRFIGASVLRLFAPNKVLATVAAIVICLLLISANSSGALAAWSLLAIGLFNSIMFPTIFSLASEGLGKRAAEGSGVICMAIVGGAVVPLLTGKTADHLGLQQALIVPAACYCGILLYGWYARKSVPALD